MPAKNEDDKSDQTVQIQPRKKESIVKRKAGSPLNDSDYTNSTRVSLKTKTKGGGGKKKGNKVDTVSNTCSQNCSQSCGFSFPDPKTNSLSINFAPQNSSDSSNSQIMNSQDPNKKAPSPNPYSLTGTTPSRNNVSGQQFIGIPPALASSQATVTPNWLPELINDVKQIKLSMTKLDQIEKTVNTINMKVSDLENKVNIIEPRITEVEKACSFISDANDDRKKELELARSEIVKLKHDCVNMKSDTDMLKQRNAHLEAKITDLESRSMRDNLLFYGIAERGKNEDCEAMIKQVCVETLELHEAVDMKFDRVHRIGTHSTSKIRPIVAKFHYFKEREQVRQRAFEKSETLKSVNLGIGKQWPSEVRDTRKALFPIMQREKSRGKNVKLVKDKLFVNDVEYKLSAQERSQTQNQQSGNIQGPATPQPWAQFNQQSTTGHHMGYPFPPPGQATPSPWANMNQLSPPQQMQRMPGNMQRMPQPPQYIPLQTQRMNQPAQQFQSAPHMPQQVQHMPQQVQHMPQTTQQTPQHVRQTPTQSTSQAQGQSHPTPVPQSPQEMQHESG